MVRKANQPHRAKTGLRQLLTAEHADICCCSLLEGASLACRVFISGEDENALAGLTAGR